MEEHKLNERSPDALMDWKEGIALIEIAIKKKSNTISPEVSISLPGVRKDASNEKQAEEYETSAR